MRKILYFILTLVLASGSACSRRVHVFEDGKTVPAGRNDEFNYHFSEGLRLRLLGEGAEALKFFERSLSVKPESDAVMFQIAQVMLSTGNIAMAKNYLIKAFNLNNRNKWYPVYLARIYDQTNNPDSTKYYLNKGHELDPENYELRLRLAEILIGEGDVVNAGKMLKDITGKYGIDERSGLVMIQSYLEAEDYDNAEIVANSLIEMFSDEIFYRTILAEIYARKGRQKEALEIFRKLMEETAEDSRVLIWYCEFLLETKEVSEFFRIAEKIAGSDNISENEKLTLFLKLIMSENLGKEDERRMIGLVELLERKYPKNQALAMLKPGLYDKNNNHMLMEESLKSIIKDDRRNYLAWEKLLFYYADNQRWDDLYQYAAEASVEFNMSYPAKILFANAALEKGNYATAAIEAGKAAVVAGGMTEAVIQAKMIEADANYRNGKYKEAFRIFSETLLLDPESTPVMNNYAYYLAEQNEQLELALELIEKVILKEPGNNTYLDTYAWVLFKMGKSRKALKIMYSIIETENISDAEYYEHTGFILKDLNKCRKATEMWEKALSLDAGKEDLKDEILKCRE